MASCGITSAGILMKIGTGVQAILMFCHSNFNVRNVSIIDRRDL
jgi:hypothetical protein